MCKRVCCLNKIDVFKRLKWKRCFILLFFVIIVCSENNIYTIKSNINIIDDGADWAGKKGTQLSFGHPTKFDQL